MKYFLDTNIIIDFLNKEPKAIEKLTEIVSENDSELFVNRLVTLESLRTIPIKNSKIFRQSKEIFENFEKIDIVPDIYNNTIEFSRYFKTEKHQSLKGKCEAIDLLHFITAKYYNLELISYDKDFERLENIYQEFLLENESK